MSSSVGCRGSRARGGVVPGDAGDGACAGEASSRNLFLCATASRAAPPSVRDRRVTMRLALAESISNPRPASPAAVWSGGCPPPAVGRVPAFRFFRPVAAAPLPPGAVGRRDGAASGCRVGAPTPAARTASSDRARMPTKLVAPPAAAAAPAPAPAPAAAALNAGRWVASPSLSRLRELLKSPPPPPPNASPPGRLRRLSPPSSSMAATGTPAARSRASRREPGSTPATAPLARAAPRAVTALGGGSMANKAPGGATCVTQASRTSTMYRRPGAGHAVRMANPSVTAPPSVPSTSRTATAATVGGPLLLLAAVGV